MRGPCSTPRFVVAGGEMQGRIARKEIAVAHIGAGSSVT